jgi:hypothetical protein
METIDAILTRKCIREYTSQAVPDGDRIVSQKVKLRCVEWRWFLSFQGRLRREWGSRGDNACDKTMWNRKDIMRVGNI